MSDNEIGILPAVTPSTLPPNLFLLDPANKEMIGTSSRRLLFNRVLVTAVIAVVMVGVSLLILLPGIRNLIGDIQLSGSSTTVNGAITQRRSAVTGGNGLAIVYYVTYRFAAGPENRTYEREQLVSKKSFDRLVQDTQVDVRYVTSDPAVSELTGNSLDNTFHNSGFLMLWLGVVGTVITGGFALVSLRRLGEESRLRRSGHLLIGHVNHCVGKLKLANRSAVADSSGAGLRGKYLIEIYYRFRTPDNHEIRKREVRRRNDLLGVVLPGPDTPIAVLYLDKGHYKVL